MKDPRDVIIEPIVSEKSYALSETGAYTFRVHASASKPEIHDAIEKIFNVKVEKVNTLNRKGKRKRKGGGKFAEADASLEAAEPVPIVLGLDEDEAKVDIVRRKRVNLVPMAEEEAIDQMELLGHDFFIFLNVETARMGVLYRREDGNYGVLEPDVK